MPAFSEWLQIMLAEISRKREDEQRASEEEQVRKSENLTSDAPQAPPTAPEQ